MSQLVSRHGIPIEQSIITSPLQAIRAGTMKLGVEMSTWNYTIWSTSLENQIITYLGAIIILNHGFVAYANVTEQA
jgi:hypothetical protein